MRICHSSQEEGACHTMGGHGGHTEKHKGQSGGKGSKGKGGQEEPLLWFPWVRVGEAV